MAICPFRKESDLGMGASACLQSCALHTPLGCSFAVIAKELHMKNRKEIQKSDPHSGK